MKNKQLEEILKRYKKVAIAFSGGIDSSFLLKKSLEVLGKENVLALVINSELQPPEEYQEAIKLAAQLGAEVKGITLSELSDPRIAANTPSSWYYSKKLFYRKMEEVMEKKNIQYLIDGMIMDDQKDFRPGMKARDEARVESPLQLAGFYKSEIRAEAKKLRLDNWNKTSTCSVASRFPYGENLTMEKVNRVLLSEKYLKCLGFDPLRVRSIGNLAKIEIELSEMPRLLERETMQKIVDQLKKNGYKTVAVDLEGFKSGRMNEGLSENEKARWQMLGNNKE